jgi:SAM-dependent methyltransferase
MRGTVERLARRELTGIVYATVNEAPVRVSLFLNSLELTSTWAADPVDPERPERGRAFRFGLLDLWTFATPDDGVTVRVDGQALPIALRTSATYHPKHSGTKSLAELRARLAAGDIFGQSGRLQLPKGDDEKWKDRVLGLYERVRSIVAEHFGYDVFVVYGSLLGVVREGGFIGHDLDFDSGYVSRHREPDAVLAEIYEISRVLHAEGLFVRSHASGLKVSSDADGGGSIDLMHLYFAADNSIKFAFGVAGTSAFEIGDWQGTETFDLAGYEVLVPKNAEALVEHTYGSSWRVPNPGFDWLRDRTSRDRPIMIPTRERELIRWNNHYRFFPDDRPTPFAVALLERDDLPRTVVDLGCGEGRDSLAFARAGRRVLGLDRSPDGIAHARAVAGDAAGVQFRVVDCCDADELGLVVDDLRTGDEPVLFYARFLLHAIEPTDQEQVLAALSRLARPGDVLACEFRTKQDTSRPVWRKYYRRLIDTERLVAALDSDYGFTAFAVDEGTGLSPSDRDDPHLGRVLARHA